MRRWSIPLVLSVILAFLIGALGSPVAFAEPPEAPSPSQSAADLDDLPIATPHDSGYDRDLFPTWSSQGNSCDTREVVIKRDGTGVVTDSTCKATSGSWYSPYDQTTFTNASDLDIDHIVPLAEAWRSGAFAWTTDKREQFANDLVDSQLIAVSASSNRSKGDSAPDEWMPPNQGYWCSYARDWIQVKTHWSLTTTAAEKSALSEMLGTC